ncbi:MAG: response regulator transcription factor [Candidatus Thiodiazotropha taylori]
MKKRAVIIDDHPLIGNSLKPLLNYCGYPEVISLTTCASGIHSINEEYPNLVLTDIELPDGSGFDVLKTCSHLFDKTNFIVISMHDEYSFAKRALDLGARGYIVKSDDEKLICDCVNAVELGKVFISNSVRDQGNDFTLEKGNGFTSKTDLDISLLTLQERRILYLMHQGKTSKQIGKELNISYRTVQNHRNNICSKYKLRGTNILLKFAIENADRLFPGGLVPIED